MVRQVLGRGMTSVGERYDKCQEEVSHVLARGMRCVWERYDKCKGKV